MTDTSPWAAPGGPDKPASPATPFSPSAAPPPQGPPAPAQPAPPPPSQPPLGPPTPFGQPLPPPAGPSLAPPPPPGATPPNPYATAPAPGMQPTPGWTPPPKPGLIPLRPLTLGTLLGASFQVMRRNPRPTFGFALLLAGAVSVLSVIGIGIAGFALYSRPFQGATADDQFTLMAGSLVGAMLLGLFVPLALGLVAFSVLQGIIALEVARGTVGEKLKLGGLWRAAKGRIAVLVGWSLLIVGATVVFFLVVGFIVGGLTVGLGSDAIGATIAVVVVGYIGFFVLAAWLGTKTALVPSILIIERLTLGKAIARSWRLTHQAFWRTFGTILLVTVIVNFATSIVTTPVQFLFGIFGGLLAPTGGTTDSIITMTVVFAAVLVVVTVIVTAIGLIVQSSAVALIYIDLRMRKEGLDLELARFVEARQAGATSVPDPYLPRVPGVVPTASAASPAGTSPWS